MPTPVPVVAFRRVSTAAAGFSSERQPGSLCDIATTGTEIDMRAQVGDRLHVYGRHVGSPEKVGRIVEVRGDDGSPPYVVRFEDGHEALLFPGSDAVVERPSEQQKG
jgi:hypothetical protein